MKYLDILYYLVALMGAVLTYLVIFTFGKNRFDRIEGIAFLLIYVGYTVYLLMR